MKKHLCLRYGKLLISTWLIFLILTLGKSSMLSIVPRFEQEKRIKMALFGAQTIF